MKKFIVVLKQSGEGCDYMIGCGQKTIEILAEDIEQAGQRFILMLNSSWDDDVDWTKDYGGYNGEQELDSAMIYEVGVTKDVDLRSAYDDIEAAKIKLKTLLEDTKEKAEYERLKNKFG
tara:strand:- start:17803 stop:18159 length:357 start_codon:yes stop_codon:yes gene_type:complete